MADILTRLRAALADRYVLEREIGVGGMATVYLAEDSRHGRKVAIKVLDPEIALALGPERFLREIEVVAGLRHPHILPLHDSGVADGLLYYVMPYVEGETLRERLEREPQLPVEEAVAITREVADGLRYAHERGVVHRDVKPENILLGAGHAVLADFGIAQTVSEVGGDRLTRTGHSLGTPAYLSPEQGLAEREVDARSDVYSLACVTYEMLAGHAPYAGSTAQAILARKSMERPPRLRPVRDAVPGHVEDAVLRALSPSPADRFGGMEEFVRALSGGARGDAPVRKKRPAAVATVVLAGLVVTAAPFVVRSRSAVDRSGPEADRGTPAPLVLAVYPFENLLGDSSFQHIVDAVHADVIAQLQGLGALRVKNRQSALTAARRAEDTREFAELLGAAVVVTGSIFGVDEGLTLGAELVDGRSGDVRSAFRMDGSLSDIMALRARFVQSVADSLGVGLTQNERRRIDSPPPVSRRAYDLYARAKGRDPTNPEALASSEAELVESVALEPTFADAWARLAVRRVRMAHMGVASPRELIPRALNAAREALEQDRDHGAALGVLAHVAYDFEYDWERADTLFRRALELDPSSAEVHQTYGAFLTAMRRFGQAERHMRTAADLDPFFPFWTASIAWPLSAAGRPDDALAHLESLPAAHRSSGKGRAMRHLALSQAGRHEDIIAETEEGRLLGRAYAGPSYALAGRRDVAAHIADSLEAHARGNYVPAILIAPIHAALGNRRQASEWLWTAYTQRDAELAHLREIPVLGRLAGEPRYEELLDTLAFPPNS